MDFYIQLMLDFQGIRDVFRMRSLSHNFFQLTNFFEHLLNIDNLFYEYFPCCKLYNNSAGCIDRTSDHSDG